MTAYVSTIGGADPTQSNPSPAGPSPLSSTAHPPPPPTALPPRRKHHIFSLAERLLPFAGQFKHCWKTHQDKNARECKQCRPTHCQPPATAVCSPVHRFPPGVPLGVESGVPPSEGKS